jgi:uncharacterized protein YwgA
VPSLKNKGDDDLDVPNDPNDVKGTDLTLCLLYVDDQYPIEGMTKFEKLVFLSKEEVLKKEKEDVPEFKFEPDRFGPLATELYDEIEYLGSSGLLSKTAQGTFAITEKGKSYFENRVRNRIDPKTVERIQQLKKRWDKKDLGELLRYVYEQYKDYTVNSEIKEKILGS